MAAIEQRKTAEAMREAEERGTPLPKDFRWMYRDDQKAAIAADAYEFALREVEE